MMWWLFRAFVSGTRGESTTDPCENQPSHAHSDDRAGAVFRAPRHPVFRVPPYPRAHGSGPSGRPCHLSLRTGRVDARAAAHPRPAAALRHTCQDRAIGGEVPPRCPADAHRIPGWPLWKLRRHPLARGRGRHRRRPVEAAAHPAPLRHALEPAATVDEFRVHRIERGPWRRALVREADDQRSRRWSSSSARRSRIPCAKRRQQRTWCSSRTHRGRRRIVRRRNRPRPSAPITDWRPTHRSSSTPAPSRRTRGSTCCSRRWPT